MVDFDPTLNLPKLVVITVFAVPIAAFEFSEWLHWRAAKAHPIEQGVVMRREEFRRFGGVPAGRLQIRLLKNNVLVSAEMSRSAMNKTPNAVQVHFGGDPNAEAVLAHESNPIYIVLLFVGLVGTLWVVYLRGRNNPKMAHVIR